MCRLRLSALFVLWSVLSTADSQCSLPGTLQSSGWEYRGGEGNRQITLTFGSSYMSNFDLSVRGQSAIIRTYDCISNKDDNYVFKSRTCFFDTSEFEDRCLYLCMRLTKVSDDLFYFYLFSDLNGLVLPTERVLILPGDRTPLDNSPTCNFCKYATPIPDSDVRTLRRVGSGTGDVVLPGITPCNPCQETCKGQSTALLSGGAQKVTLLQGGEMTTTVLPDPCQCSSQYVNNIYARRKFEWIAKCRNGDDFIPKNPPAGYKFATVTVHSVCLGETPYNYLARINTIDPATVATTCPNAFAHLQVGETYTFFGTIQWIEGRRTFVVDQCTPPAKTTSRACAKNSLIKIKL